MEKKGKGKREGEWEGKGDKEKGEKRKGKPFLYCTFLFFLFFLPSIKNKGAAFIAALPRSSDSQSSVKTDGTCYKWELEKKIEKRERKGETIKKNKRETNRNKNKRKEKEKEKEK